jgi:hypothetical protein
MQETSNIQFFYRDLAIVMAMALFVIYAISRVVYPKLFASVYSYARFFSTRLRDDFGSGIRLFSTENFYFTAVLSLNFSFAAVCLYLFTPSVQATIPWLAIESMGKGLLVWLLTAMAIQFLFFLKFLFVAWFGWLFGIPTDQSRHFSEIQLMNNGLSVVMYLILAISLFGRFSFPEFTVKLILATLAFYLVFRFFNLFLKIRNLGASSNLYIFSYLCSTELIPTLLGLNLLV